jgi:SPOR domain
MRDLYGDDLESVAGDGARLLPRGVRGIAGALVFVGLIGAMGVWAWRLGTRDATDVPIIRAMEGPATVVPEAPGGLQAAHQGLEVNGVLAGQPARRDEVATARPAAQVLADEDASQGELVMAAPAVLAERIAAASGSLPSPQEIAPSKSLQDAVDEPEALLGDETGVADAPDSAGPRPMNRPRDLVLARPRTTPVAEPSPKAKTAAEAETKASRPAKPAAPQAEVHEVATAQKGSRMVQLGAYDSEAMTRQAWSRLVSANPDLLSSKSLYVERTTANARVFYRLRVAGFQSSDQTRVMCESLRARGIDCIPVTVQ